MFKIVFLVATLAGVGAAEVHTSALFETEEDCHAAIADYTAWIDGGLRVTYHCVEVEEDV